MRLRECGLVPWWWLKDETRDVSTWRHHDREVARKAVGALDENHAHAVASDAVEHGLEARTLGRRIGSAHGRVVELEGDSRAPWQTPRWPRAAAVTVLIAPDICGRGGP